MLGTSSDLRPFWVADLQDQRVYVSQQQLAKNILPGLGLDRVRFAATRLPATGGPLPHTIFAEFDAAVRDYDAGRSGTPSGGSCRRCVPRARPRCASPR